MTTNTTGYFLFEGIRRKGHSTYVESVNAPVEVITVVFYRKPKELAVKMIGRQQAFPLSHFEGTWTRLEVSNER